MKKNLPRPDVRKSFRKLLAQSEHVEELWEEGFDALLKEDYRKWDLLWLAIREAIGQEETRKLLNKVVGSEKNEGKLTRLPTEVRARLRTACAEAGLMPPQSLLVPVGLGELEPLLASPPDCAGYSAFVLMARDELGWLEHIPPSDRPRMRKRAREFLYTATPAALAAYVHAARDYLDTNSYFLDVLFTPYSPAAAKLMDKLLSVDTLEPGDWMKLCRSVGLTQNQWGEYLLEKDRLANLLYGLRGDEGGREVWDAYLSSLTSAVISPAMIEVNAGDDPRVIHDWERKVHGHLRLAAERLAKIGVKLAPALPEGGVVRLFAANNLIKWMDDPASAERDGWEEVNHACAIYEVDPLHLVSVAFHEGGFDQCDPGTEAKSLAPILALFRTCFPVDANFNTASRAAREAVRLSHECPAPVRRALRRCCSTPAYWRFTTRHCSTPTGTNRCTPTPSPGSMSGSTSGRRRAGRSMPAQPVRRRPYRWWKRRSPTRKHRGNRQRRNRWRRKRGSRRGRATTGRRGAARRASSESGSWFW